MKALYKKPFVRFGSIAILMFALVTVVAAQEVTPEAPTPEVAAESTPNAEATPDRPGRGNGGENESRPFLGVQIAETEAETSVVGALIVEVVPGSPAEAAGLQAGDIITAIDGIAIETANAVVEIIRSAEIDSTVALIYTRGEESTTVEVTLTVLTREMEEAFEEGQPGRDDDGQGGNGTGRGGNGFDGQGFGNMPFDPQMGGMFIAQNGRLGVVFVTLNTENAAEYETDVMTGAIITEVVADSPAAEAGLQTNDIITAVNGEIVDEERTLRDRLIAYEPGDSITLSVTRADETLDITMTLGEPAMNAGDFFSFEGMPEGFPFTIPGDAPMQPEVTPEATPNA